MGRLALVLSVAVLALAASTATAGAATATSSCRGLAIRAAWTTPLRRSPLTSCAFARNLARASFRFIVRHPVGDGDFYVWASSPVTHRWYHAHCWGDGDLYADYGVRVSCRAGHGAWVAYRTWGW